MNLSYQNLLPEIKPLVFINQVYNHLLQKYGHICNSLDSPNQSIPSDIWWCWFQGLENAPPLVKACFSSVSNLNRPITLITEDNFADYAAIPDFVIDKWKAGVISYAHFSDILRLVLLTEHGGTWIDSTVLITDNYRLPCPDNTGLFCFKNLLRGFNSDYVLASSWYISSSPQNSILKDTLSMLYEYWQNESELIHYFLVHLFFTISCRKHAQEWQKVPTVSNLPPHLMAEELLQPFSEDRWNRLCNASSIHKLSYKIQRPQTDTCLLYDYILDNYLPK